MKKFIFRIVLIVFLIVSMFFGIKKTHAQGSIYFIAPENGAQLSGIVTLKGYYLGTIKLPQLFTLYLDGIISQTQIICDSPTVTYTTGNNFNCSWDTNNTPPGLHNIKIASEFYENQNIVSVFSDVREINISNTDTSSESSHYICYNPKKVCLKVSGAGVNECSSYDDCLKSPTPSPQIPTPTPESTTTSVPVPGRPDLSPIPLSIPVTSPTPPIINPVQEKLLNSVLSGFIEFNLFTDKNFNLKKIETRRTQNQQKFMVLYGIANINSYIKITVNSQPLVMTTKTDENGNWNYILEKPLEPGKHEVYLEVDNNGTVETSGPYPFNIAKAQATADNPSGASLDLIDPQKQNMRNYILITLGVIALGILILLIYLYMKRIKQLRNTNSPAKGINAN